MDCGVAGRRPTEKNAVGICENTSTLAISHSRASLWNLPILIPLPNTTASTSTSMFGISSTLATRGRASYAIRSTPMRLAIVVVHPDKVE